MPALGPAVCRARGLGARGTDGALHARSIFFYGIPAPLRRQLQRQHLKTCSQPLDPIDVAVEMWALPARECQLSAVDLLNQNSTALDADRLASCVADLAQRKAWWDTVDALASNALAQSFRCPAARERWLPHFRRSPHMWLRRCALLFQLKYRDQINASLLFDIVEENLHSGTFFIDKAIGWALREYAKQDADAVRRFVDSQPLAALSRREALRGQH